MISKKKLLQATALVTVMAFYPYSGGAASEEPRADFGPMIVQAADQGNQTVVESLINTGTSANEKGKFGSTALMRAAFRGNDKIAEILLKAGGNPNVADVGGATALHMAARQGNLSTVKMLIKAGANVNATDNEGWTPLMRASLNGNAQIASALIAAGAGINNVNDLGESALVQAVESGSKSTVGILVESGAKTAARNGEGIPVDAMAKAKGRDDIASLLASPAKLAVAAAVPAPVPAPAPAVVAPAPKAEEVAKAPVPAPVPAKKPVIEIASPAPVPAKKEETPVAVASAPIADLPEKSRTKMEALSDRNPEVKSPAASPREVEFLTIGMDAKSRNEILSRKLSGYAEKADEKPADVAVRQDKSRAAPAPEFAAVEMDTKLRGDMTRKISGYMAKAEPPKKEDGGLGAAFAGLFGSQEPEAKVRNAEPGVQKQEKKPDSERKTLAVPVKPQVLASAGEPEFVVIGKADNKALQKKISGYMQKPSKTAPGFAEDLENALGKVFGGSQQAANAGKKKEEFWDELEKEVLAKDSAPEGGVRKTEAIHPKPEEKANSELQALNASAREAEFLTIGMDSKSRNELLSKKVSGYMEKAAARTPQEPGFAEKIQQALGLGGKKKEEQKPAAVAAPKPEEKPAPKLSAESLQDKTQVFRADIASRVSGFLSKSEEDSLRVAAKETPIVAEPRAELASNAALPPLGNAEKKLSAISDAPPLKQEKTEPAPAPAAEVKKDAKVKKAAAKKEEAKTPPAGDDDKSMIEQILSGGAASGDEAGLEKDREEILKKARGEDKAQNPASGDRKSESKEKKKEEKAKNPEPQAAAPSPEPETRNSELPPAETELRAQPASSEPVPLETPEKVEAVEKQDASGQASYFLLRLGAFKTEKEAKAKAVAIKKANAAALGGVSVIAEEIDGGKYAVNAGVFDDRASAADSCNALVSAKVDCQVVETSMLGEDRLAKYGSRVQSQPPKAEEKPLPEFKAPAPSSELQNAEPSKEKQEKSFFAGIFGDEKKADDETLKPKEKPIPEPVIEELPEKKSSQPWWKVLKAEEAGSAEPVEKKESPKAEPVAQAASPESKVQSVEPVEKPVEAKELPKVKAEPVAQAVLSEPSSPKAELRTPATPPEPATRNPQPPAAPQEARVEVSEAVRLPLDEPKIQGDDMAKYQSATPSQEVNGSRWVQVGYFLDQQAADGFWSEVTSRVPQSGSVLRMRSVRSYMGISSGSQKFSVQLGPVANAAQANLICGVARTRGLACGMVVSNSSAYQYSRDGRHGNRLFPERGFGGFGGGSQEWTVQFGTFAAYEDAMDKWKEVKRKSKLLRKVEPDVIKPEYSSAGGRSFYLRAGVFSFREAAENFCESLESSFVDCVVVRK